MENLPLTSKEAAEILGITPGRIRQLARAGEIPATKKGNLWFLSKADVEQHELKPVGRRQIVNQDALLTDCDEGMPLKKVAEKYHTTVQYIYTLRHRAKKRRGN